MATPDLSPAEKDISVDILNKLFGEGWENLFSGGGGEKITLLGEMFQTFNIALMGFVVALLVYQVSVMSLQTAHEGVTLGRRYHSIYAPLRAPMAIFFLTPMPFLKGLTVLQGIALVLLSFSIGVADKVWSSFVGYIPKHTETLIIDQTMSRGREDIINAALVSMTLVEASNTLGGRAVDFQKVKCEAESTSHGVCLFQAVDGRGIKADYGSFVISCGTPPQGIMNKIGDFFKYSFGNKKTISQNIFDTPECQQRQQIVTDLLEGARPIAQAIVAYSQNEGDMPADALPSLLDQFNASMQSAIEKLTKDGEEGFKKAVEEWNKTSSELGWMASIAYYPFTASLIASAEQSMNEILPSFSMANLNLDPEKSRQSFGIEKADYQSLITTLQTYMETSDMPSQAFKAAGGDAEIKGYVNKFFGGMLQSYAHSLSSGGNLLVYMGAKGHEALQWGEWILLGGTVVSAAAPAAGLAAGGPFGAIVGSIASMVLNSLGGLASLIGIALIVEGAIMAYVLPFLPSMVMLFAAVGWIILVVEMFVALPLWAAAVAFADGDGLTPQEARYGMGIFGGIMLRPLLLVFGFVFVFLALTFASQLVGLAFGSYLAVHTESGIGPVGFVSLLGMLVVAATSLVYFIAKMITHLADHAPQWIGGNPGASLGSEHAATSATQQVSGLTKAGAGGLVQNTVRGAAEGKRGYDKAREIDIEAKNKGFRSAQHKAAYEAAAADYNNYANYGNKADPNYNTNLSKKYDKMMRLAPSALVQTDSDGGQASSSSSTGDNGQLGLPQSRKTQYKGKPVE